MARCATWISWGSVACVACGRTGLGVSLDDAEGSGGALPTGGVSTSGVSGTALAGTSGSGGVGASITGGVAGVTSGAGFGGSGGSAGASGSGHVLGCEPPDPSPVTRCERLRVGAQTFVETTDTVSLVPLRSDGRCVSVVTSRVQDGARELAALTFMPWQHWPSTLGPLGPLTKIPLSDVPSPRFTVRASDQGRLALAWEKPDGAIAFGWDVDPSSFVGSYVDVDRAVRSYDASFSSIGHLVLVSSATSLSTRTWAPPQSSGYANHQGPCADGELSGGVEPFDDGFLVAASTGVDNVESHGCPHYPDLGGPPTSIVVWRHPDLCCSYLQARWDAGGVVTRIRTAPHPDGIWVVWQTNDGGTPVLRRARVARDGPTPISYDTIGESWSVPGAFDAVVLDSRLAVVWADSYAGVHALRVTLVSEDAPAEDFSPGLGIPADLEDIAAVASPEGLVLGYGRGLLQRLSCQPSFR